MFSQVSANKEAVAVQSSVSQQITPPVKMLLAL